MSLESADWISELDTNNPTATDVRSQGDDHLRLIKTVLKACFPTASKAFYNPTTEEKDDDFTVVATDMNKLFVVDAEDDVNVTLPTLAAEDAGWECSFIKVTVDDGFAIFVSPPSGQLLSGDLMVDYCRRAIPGVRFKAFWTGGLWVVDRIPREPVGTVLLWHIESANPPAGYLWANGDTFDEDAYLELFTKRGTDNVGEYRGRAPFGRDDMGGVAAGTLTSFDATAFGASDGSEFHTLGRDNLPDEDVEVDISDSGHAHDVKYTDFLEVGSGAGVVPKVTSISSGGSDTGSGAAISNTTGITAGFHLGEGDEKAYLPPLKITNFIVVAE